MLDVDGRVVLSLTSPRASSAVGMPLDAQASQRGRTAASRAELTDQADACETRADQRRARRKRSRASAAVTAAAAAMLRLEDL